VPDEVIGQDRYFSLGITLKSVHSLGQPVEGNRMKKRGLIDNVGHYPMLEKPDEFNRRLREVVKELASRR
jgi:pimeloyl-ACP methyl ester carboxylesterase